MRSLPRLACWVLCMGCAHPVEVPSAAADVGPEAEVDVPTCRVEGTAPFAVRFQGELPDRWGPIVVDAWFPAGRQAGKPVFLRWAGQLAVATSDAAGRATWSLPDPCAPGLRFTLGATPGLAIEGTVDGYGGRSDAPHPLDVGLTLCPLGVPPVTTPGVGGAASLFPTAALSAGAVPADPASLAAVRATPAWDLTVGPTATGFFVAPKTAFAPFREIALDLSAARDVMGVPYGLSVTKTLALTAVVADPTFGAPLPTGAFLGTPPVSGAGRLRIPAPPSAGDYDTLVGLGDAGAARTVRLRHRLVCDVPGGATVRLISERGELVPLTPKCGADPIDEVATLPSGGRWALHARAQHVRTGCHTDSAYAPAAYELSALAFE